MWLQRISATLTLSHSSHILSQAFIKQCTSDQVSQLDLVSTARFMGQAASPYKDAPSRLPVDRSGVSKEQLRRRFCSHDCCSNPENEQKLSDLGLLAKSSSVFKASTLPQSLAESRCNYKPPRLLPVVFEE